MKRDRKKHKSFEDWVERLIYILGFFLTLTPPPAEAFGKTRPPKPWSLCSWVQRKKRQWLKRNKDTT